ncbi:MAG: Positive regulator of sigma(E), RseC/MucC [Planctomycetes bacterium ADurb.Bin401]|nr:MAG: Positive regulator of sigma(E), RseC/MucC [Planctomycetes bacterium ADurb.Bin401]
MDQQQCQSCSMKDHCGTVYKALGESKVPNVLGKVILAFLLPLLLFIISVVGAERLLTGRLMNRTAGSLISFVLALAAVFVYLIILKLWRRNN